MQKRRVRTLAVGVVATLVAGALLTGSGSAGTAGSVTLPQLTRDQLLAIANVDAPPAGVGLQIHADFPEEAPLLLDGIEVYSLTAAITPEGGVMTHSVHTSENTTGAGARIGECDNPTFKPTGVKWDADGMPIEWHLNFRSIPKKLHQYNTGVSVRRAHRVWPRAITNCGKQDRFSFSYLYKGHGHRNPKYDGINIVDFGRLGGGALAVNYTWYSGTRIVEVDLRLNRYDYRWTNNPEYKGAYQVANVVAHELGHQIGLDDLGDPNRNLTMFARIGRGETAKETLGRGDLRGAAALSP